LAPGACAGTRPSQIAGSPSRGPPAPTGGTVKRAGPPQPRRRWRAESETQSAGYARRRRPSRDRGRGFDSRRLHWFARDRQSGTCLHDSVICGWIVCDKRDTACREFRRPSPNRVAGESQINASGQSRTSRSTFGARDQYTLASVTIAKARAHAAVTLVCRPERACDLCRDAPASAQEQWRWVCPGYRRQPRRELLVGAGCSARHRR
jgi:hypothetical protein